MEKSEDSEFVVAISSDDENKYLIADICYGEFSICTVDTEFGYFGVTFSSDPRINYNQDFVHANLDDFVKTLERAKKELKEFPNGLS